MPGGTGSPLHHAEGSPEGVPGNGPAGSNNLGLNPLLKLEKPRLPGCGLKKATAFQPQAVPEPRTSSHQRRKVGTVPARTVRAGAADEENVEGKFPAAMRTSRPLLRSRAAPGPAPPDSQSHTDTGKAQRPLISIGDGKSNWAHKIYWHKISELH